MRKSAERPLTSPKLLLYLHAWDTSLPSEGGWQISRDGRQPPQRSCDCLDHLKRCEWLQTCCWCMDRLVISNERNNHQEIVNPFIWPGHLRFLVILCYKLWRWFQVFCVCVPAIYLQVVSSSSGRSTRMKRGRPIFAWVFVPMLLWDFLWRESSWLTRTNNKRKKLHRRHK